MWDPPGPRISLLTTGPPGKNLLVLLSYLPILHKSKQYLNFCLLLKNWKYWHLWWVEGVRRPAMWNTIPILWLTPTSTNPYCLPNAEDEERTSGYLSSHLCCYLSHVMETFPYIHTFTEMMKMKCRLDIISCVCMSSIIFFLCLLYYIFWMRMFVFLL